MIKRDGGPAFPRTGEMPGGGGYPHLMAQSGMTLRDHFAGLAMAAMVASTLDAFDDDSITCAEKAYEYADSMLEARAR